MLVVNRAAIVVRPGQPFLEWLHWADPTSAPLTLADLQADPSIYLIPDVEVDEDFAKHLERVCEEIFEEQLESWFRDEDVWPVQRDFNTFQRWFESSFHSMVFDTVPRPIRRER